MVEELSSCTRLQHGIRRFQNILRVGAFAFGVAGLKLGDNPDAQLNEEVIVNGFAADFFMPLATS